jgi:hypothetical protein
MASVIGYEGGVWLVLILLVLASGLTWALLAATRDAAPRPVERARPPR